MKLIFTFQINRYFTQSSLILRAFTVFATETLEKYYKELKVNPAVAKVPIIVSWRKLFGTQDVRKLRLLRCRILLLP